ncbi:hypothetical protein P3T73_04155 [Kiritimatiellota bacterium B12222]|nr:hypothetical protein P3T73_04155 [Kiritimatiellota bacterium B12222]
MIEQSALHLLLQIAISAAAALFGTRLAAKRFREDRQWERKMETYSELIEMLHHMKWPANELIRAEIEHINLSDEENERLWSKYSEARQKVSMLAESSSFLISKNVLESVINMENRLTASKSVSGWIDHLDSHYRAVDDCLKTIKTIGAKELEFDKNICVFRRENRKNRNENK